MTKRLFLALILVGSSAAIAEDKPMQFNDDIVGKIAVLHNGQVSFNGNAVTIEQLKKSLVDLKAQNGVVWYYREDPMGKLGEPPAITTQVIQAVIDNKLSVSISTEPDYSTVALPDGTIKPRLHK